jgi:hypothetical protein
MSTHRVRARFGVVSTVVALVASAAIVPSGLAAAPDARPLAVEAAQPVRVLDTRSGLGGTSGLVAPGAVVKVPVTAAPGATSVVLNLTATGATAGGWARAWPCEEPQPATSSINFTPGRDVANAVVVKVGATGVCLATSAPVNLIADISGWMTGSNDVRSISPARLVDTRDTNDRLGAEQERRIDVAGRAGVGDDAGLAVFNLTVDRPAATGWAVLYPCGSPSNGSTINYLAGETVASTTIVGLGGGDICVKSSADTEVILDVYGWATWSGSLKAQTPTRLLDTRDAATWPYGRAASTSTITLRVAGRGGVPNTAAAALLTVTVDQPGGDGYVAAWPCDGPFPPTSMLNTWQDVPRANFTLAKLSVTDGTVCLQYFSNNGEPTSLIVDAVGWIEGSFVRSPPPATPTPPSVPGGGGVPHAPTGDCAFSIADQPVSVAFCDTFDAPDGTPSSRSGDLNYEVWGVSRAPGDTPWRAAPAPCGGGGVVLPPRDVQICNGQLRDSVNDNGGVTTLAMYPKQPFDFAGRTGTVVFDVSNDSEGNHGAWPEFWLSDKPVPAPFSHEDTWKAIPANGFGIRFAGCTNSNGAPTQCSRGPNSVGVDSAEVVRNYVDDDSFNGGDLTVVGRDSVIRSGPGQMNHYEIRVSQNQIDVWATDAYSGALDLAKTPLRHIATIPDANLTITKGLVWLEDAHYNGSKFGTQGAHVFAWDNLGFDGPKTYRDLSFDVPDANVPNGDGTVDLGYDLPAGGTRSFAVNGVFRKQAPTGALVTFQWMAFDQSVPSVRVNGGAWHDTAWPFDSTTYSSRVIAVPIDASEVVDGTNTLEFKTANGTVIHNINLILVAGAAVP